MDSISLSDMIDSHSTAIVMGVASKQDLQRSFKELAKQRRNLANSLTVVSTQIKTERQSMQTAPFSFLECQSNT